MNKSTIGVILALLFVLLESTQFVFFGGLFQRMNSFLFGFLVFGITIILFIGYALVKNPEQVRAAFANPKQLIAVNLGALVTFTAYLTSVQLVEPAITYTISCGAMPITAYVMYRLGIQGGEDMRNNAEAFGTILIFCGIIFLACITIFGWSGFVRGGWSMAVLGVILAAIDGIFFTLILVYSQRLNTAGVGPSAVLGLRLPLYVLVAGSCALFVTDQKEALENSEIIWYVLIGLLLTIPPLYLLQKAVPLISTLTISALTALGPFVIFSLQLVEGRIDYAPATIIGLMLYFSGAILASIGAVKGTSQTA